MIIKPLTYSRKYIKDGDSYYEFLIKKTKETLSYRETKLLKSASFKKGVDYEINFKDKTYPVEISWNNGKVYIKGNNSIVSVDSNGVEKTNESVRMMLWKATRHKRNSSAKTPK